MRSRPFEPRAVARLAGVLWLACILIGVPGYFLVMPMIAQASAGSASAASIALSESQFRLGLVFNLLSGIVYLGATALLYPLLKPSGAVASFAAVCFGLAGVAFGALWPLVAVVPLNLIHGGAITSAAAQQMIGISMETAEQVSVIGLVFFGIQVVLIGSLIVRGQLVPRAIGLLLTAGGSSYVVGAITTLLSPDIGAGLLRVVMAIAVIGEGSLAAWLAARGVNETMWAKREALYGT